MKIPEFKLERYFARYEFAVPYLLSSSDLEPHRLGELLELATEEERERWNALSLGYTESAGHPLLRAAIASLYETVDPDEVLVFTGAGEAILAYFSVVFAPGDHAVVVWPAYQSLHEVARAEGAEVTLVRLESDRGWGLDLDAVRSAIRPTTRAIVVNFPHNPTGATIDDASLALLAEIARDAKAQLFSDEVYRGLEYDRSEQLRPAVDISDSAVSLGVMSKVFGLAGLRIGWIATHDRPLLARLAAFKDYSTICCSAPSEVLATIALRNKDAVLDRNHAIVEANLEHADRFFKDWAGTFQWVRPRAGCIAFPRLLADAPIDALAKRLAEDAGVMLLPGSVYDHPQNHFRLGYGRRNFPEALERFEYFMRSAL